MSAREFLRACAMIFGGMVAADSTLGILVLARRGDPTGGSILAVLILASWAGAVVVLGLWGKDRC